MACGDSLAVVITITEFPTAWDGCDGMGWDVPVCSNAPLQQKHMSCPAALSGRFPRVGHGWSLETFCGRWRSHLTGPKLTKFGASHWMTRAPEASMTANQTVKP